MNKKILTIASAIALGAFAAAGSVYAAGTGSAEGTAVVDGIGDMGTLALSGLEITLSQAQLETAEAGDGTLTVALGNFCTLSNVVNSGNRQFALTATTTQGSFVITGRDDTSSAGESISYQLLVNGTPLTYNSATTVNNVASGGDAIADCGAQEALSVKLTGLSTDTKAGTYDFNVSLAASAAPVVHQAEAQVGE